MNENEYAVSDFKTRPEAVRKLEVALTVKVKDSGESSGGSSKTEANEVLARGRCNALQPAPRRDRELNVVIGVNLKLGVILSY